MREALERITTEIAQDRTAELRAETKELQSQLRFLHGTLLGQSQYLTHQNQLLSAEVSRLNFILNQTIGASQILAAENHYLHRRIDGLVGEFEKFKDRLESRSKGDHHYFTPPLSTDSDRSSTPSEGHRSPVSVEDAPVTKANLKFTTLHGIEAEIDPNKTRVPLTKKELKKMYPDINTRPLEYEDLDGIFKPIPHSRVTRSLSSTDPNLAERATKETPRKAEVATDGTKARTTKRRLQFASRRISTRRDLVGTPPSESPPSKKVEDPSSPHKKDLARQVR